MREKDFSTKVLKLLRAEFPGHWRKNPVSAYGQSGVGDIIGCLEGRYVEIELKAPGRYKDPFIGLSEIQRLHGAEIIGNGGIWMCADSWPEIKGELLAQIKD